MDLSKLRVLVVDDLPSARKIVKRLLEKMGVGVVDEVSDGQAAIEKVKTETFNLIISDWLMPKLSGLEFLKAVRAEGDKGAVPFIMITSSGVKEHVVEAFSVGVTDFIVKPFNADTLQQKILSVLERSHSDANPPEAS